MKREIEERRQQLRKELAFIEEMEAQTEAQRIKWSKPPKPARVLATGDPIDPQELENMKRELDALKAETIEQDSISNQEWKAKVIAELQQMAEDEQKL